MPLDGMHSTARALDWHRVDYDSGHADELYTPAAAVKPPLPAGPRTETPPQSKPASILHRSRKPKPSAMIEKMVSRFFQDGRAFLAGQFSLLKKIGENLGVDKVTADFGKVAAKLGRDLAGTPEKVPSFTTDQLRLVPETVKNILQESFSHYRPGASDLLPLVTQLLADAKVTTGATFHKTSVSIPDVPVIGSVTLDIQEGAWACVGASSRSGIVSPPRYSHLGGFSVFKLMDFTHVQLEDGKLNIGAPGSHPLSFDITDKILASPLSALFPAGRITGFPLADLAKVVLGKNGGDNAIAQALTQSADKIILKSQAFNRAHPENGTAVVDLTLDAQKTLANLKAQGFRNFDFSGISEKSVIRWPHFPLNKLPLPSALSFQQATADIQVTFLPEGRGADIHLANLRAAGVLIGKIPVEVDGGLILSLRRGGKVEVTFDNLKGSIPTLASLQLPKASLQASLAGTVSGRVDEGKNGLRFSLGRSDLKLHSIRTTLGAGQKLRVDGMELHAADLLGEAGLKASPGTPADVKWNLEGAARGRGGLHELGFTDPLTGKNRHWNVSGNSSGSARLATGEDGPEILEASFKTHDFALGIHDNIPANTTASARLLTEIHGMVEARYQPRDMSQNLQLDWNISGNIHGSRDGLEYSVWDLASSGTGSLRRHQQWWVPNLSGSSANVSGTFEWRRDGDPVLQADNLALSLSGRKLEMSSEAIREEATLEVRGESVRMGNLSLKPDLSFEIAATENDDGFSINAGGPVRAALLKPVPGFVQADFQATTDLDTLEWSLKMARPQQAGNWIATGHLEVKGSGNLGGDEPLPLARRLATQVEVRTPQPLSIIRFVPRKNGEPRPEVFLRQFVLDADYDETALHPLQATTRGRLFSRIPFEVKAHAHNLSKISGEYAVHPGHVATGSLRASGVDIGGLFRLDINRKNPELSRLKVEGYAETDLTKPLTTRLDVDYAGNARWNGRHLVFAFKNGSSELDANYTVPLPERHPARSQVRVGPFALPSKKDLIWAQARMHGTVWYDPFSSRIGGRDLGLQKGYVWMGSNGKAQPLISNLELGADILHGVSPRLIRCGGEWGCYATALVHTDYLLPELGRGPAGAHPFKIFADTVPLGNYSFMLKNYLEKMGKPPQPEPPPEKKKKPEEEKPKFPKAALMAGGPP